MPDQYGEYASLALMFISCNGEKNPVLGKEAELECIKHPRSWTRLFDLIMIAPNNASFKCEDGSETTISSLKLISLYFDRIKQDVQHHFLGLSINELALTLHN